MNTNLIRLADARNIIESAINICFGRYFRSEDYLYDGAAFTSYELFDEMSKGSVKIRITDADVQFKLDGYTIFFWNDKVVSSIDEDRVRKHLAGWSIVDMYIDFFATAKGLCEKFNKKKTT